MPTDKLISGARITDEDPLQVADAAALAAIQAGKPSALGQATAVESVPVVLASDQNAVPVKGATDSIRVTPTITAGAYSANDVVGGVLEFVDAALDAGGGGVIETVVITCRANVAAALTIFFFSATPSSAIDDNGAMSWGTADADLALYLGSVNVLASDYKSVVSNKQTATIPNVGIAYECAATSLFAYAVCTGTPPTYVATTDLGIRISVLH